MTDAWQPIASAGDRMDRVFVAGWQKPHGNVRGYWWWHEDVVCDGKAIEHPEATLWCPIRIPPFPSSPTDRSK